MICAISEIYAIAFKIAHFIILLTTTALLILGSTQSSNNWSGLQMVNCSACFQSKNSGAEILRCALLLAVCRLPMCSA